MPLDRSHRLTDQSIAMERPEDVDLVLDALRRAPNRSGFTRGRAFRDAAEEIGYQALIHPAWIQPHLTELVLLGATEAMGFDWQCELLDGAPADLVDGLSGRLATNPTDRVAIHGLLATRQPAALARVAEIARTEPAIAAECRLFGFLRMRDATLEPRFTVERAAPRLVDAEAEATDPHVAMLPLEDVASEGENRIAFHYLSITPSAIGSMPPWVGRAHAVAPRNWPDWTLWSAADPDGRLRVMDLELGPDRSLDSMVDLLDEAAGAAGPPRRVELAPFDDRLVFANQHPLLTPGAIGVVGGPPMGMRPAPDCPRCARLMYHVGWLDTGSVAEYGDGFRSLFLCEDCRISATSATLWN